MGSAKCDDKTCGSLNKITHTHTASPLPPLEWTHTHTHRPSLTSSGVDTHTHTQPLPHLLMEWTHTHTRSPSLTSSWSGHTHTHAAPPSPPHGVDTHTHTQPLPHLLMEWTHTHTRSPSLTSSWSGHTHTHTAPPSPPHGVGVVLPPVVLQSVGDAHHIRGGLQAEGRLCGHQEMALHKQLLLLWGERLAGQQRPQSTSYQREVCLSLAMNGLTSSLISNMYMSL